MQRVVLFLILAVMLFFPLSEATVGFAANQGTVQVSKPLPVLQLFKKKYPNEVVVSVRSVDLNYDKKIDHVLLTKQGNLWLTHNNGQNFAKVDGGIISDPDLNPASIFVFSPVPGEVQIVAAYLYFPSNKQVNIYRWNKGMLQKIFSIMGDQGVFFENKQIVQLWKNYGVEGGWDQVATTYEWDNKNKVYKKVSTKSTGINSDGY